MSKTNVIQAAHIFRDKMIADDYSANDNDGVCDLYEIASFLDYLDYVLELSNDDTTDPHNEEYD